MKSSPIAKSRRLWAVAVAATVLVSARADAAGLFLTPRGVRPLARGGAFIAGADDVNALSYNPAGLAFAPRQILIDMAYSVYDTTFTRTIDGADQPTVNGTPLRFPLPTIGFVHDFGLVPNLTFGGSIGADTPAIQNWPEQMPNGSPAPSRYSIQGYRGTALAKINAGAAYHPIPEFAVGITASALVGTFADQKAASACDGVICTQAEDPAHDAIVQFSAKNVVSPGFTVGAIFNPVDWLKIGAAFESGYSVNKTGDLKMRLPSAAEYDSASLSPAHPKANVRLTLPWSARFGVEARNNLVRVELAAVYDHWSSFKTVTIAPQNVVINNVLALGNYKVGNIDIDPRFRSIWSVRLGSEWTPEIDGQRNLTLRLGGFIEPSAIPDQTLSPEWVDLKKTFVTGGGGYKFGKVLLDFTVAVGFFKNRTITDSQAEQQNPLRPPFPGRTFVGNGRYSASDWIAGLSFRYLLD